MTIARCRYCHADIRWVDTVNGRKMPLDALPVLNGNVIIDADGIGVVMGQLDLSNLPADVERFRSHHADPNCSGSSEHKRLNRPRLADFGRAS